MGPGVETLRKSRASSSPTPARTARRWPRSWSPDSQVAGFEPYLDKHDIAAAEDWEARLGGLIQSADTVVFILSPAAVKSPRCAWEVDRAAELGKRLIPVVGKAVPEAETPERLRRLNYIYFSMARPSPSRSPSWRRRLGRTSMDPRAHAPRRSRRPLAGEARAGAADDLLLRGEETHRRQGLGGPREGAMRRKSRRW